MARLLTSGAEWNDATAEGVTLGAGTTITTTNPRSGTYCYTGNSGTEARFLLTGVLGTTYYLRAYYYFQDFAVAASTVATLSFETTVPAVLARLRLTDTGLIQLVAGTTVIATSANPISLNTYTRLELSLLLGTGSIDAVEGLIDGVSFGSATGLNISDTLTWRASTYLPTLATGTSSYADDIALNDSTGAAQNSWPGAGSVALLRPTADSAVGTGWTLGNTTATGGNAWQREDNIPPDSATDLTATADATQIRNATSNANVNYDATMTTYTAAGVTGTVNVVVPQVATGAPVVTSAKAGTVGVASNPAIANVSLGAAGTAGAFWQGNAIGTYPTGNKWSFGTTTYAPTVTLGTAPVMRVTQVTSSTRIAIVSEMGIYVDYTPAVVIAPTPLVHQSVPFYPTPSRPS